MDLFAVGVIITLQEFLTVICHTTHRKHEEKMWWIGGYVLMSIMVPMALVNNNHDHTTIGLMCIAMTIIHPFSQWYAVAVWTDPWWRTSLWRGFSDRWHLLAWGRHASSMLLLYVSGMPLWGSVVVALACEAVWFSVKRKVLGAKSWPMLITQFMNSLKKDR